MSLGLKDVGLARELIRGLGVTLRYLFSKPVTVQYPTQRQEPLERFRGLIRWDQNKCAACVLCEHYCPAKAIDIRTGAAEDGRKVVLHYQVDATHCMLCGFCVEICPVGALSHSHHYELAVYNSRDAVYAQERMTGDPPITKYR